MPDRLGFSNVGGQRQYVDRRILGLKPGQSRGCLVNRAVVDEENADVRISHERQHARIIETARFVVARHDHDHRPELGSRHQTRLATAQ